MPFIETTDRYKALLLGEEWSSGSKLDRGKAR